MHKKQFYFYLYVSSGSTFEFLRHSLKPYEQIGIKTKQITHKDIIQNDILTKFPENVLALFMPGGRSGQQVRDDLGEEGSKKIKDYVRIGGTYIGKCRGGYLGCEQIIYEGQSGKKEQISNLNFFQATAYGQLPLYDPRFPKPRRGWEDANVTPVTFGNKYKKKTMVVYWGGPRVVAFPGESIDIIATYDNVLNDDGTAAIAVAAKQYGDGRAVVSGVHSEIGYQILCDSAAARNIDAENDHFRMEMVDILKVHEKDRLDLFHHTVAEAFKSKNGKRYCDTYKKFTFNTK